VGVGQPVGLGVGISDVRGFAHPAASERGGRPPEGIRDVRSTYEQVRDNAEELTAHAIGKIRTTLTRPISWSTLALSGSTPPRRSGRPQATHPVRGEYPPVPCAVASTLQPESTARPIRLRRSPRAMPFCTAGWPMVDGLHWEV